MTDVRGRVRWLLGDVDGELPPENAREARAAEPELLGLARAGDPVAQTLAGVIALVVRHRPKRARRWFEAAAAQGEPAARRSLGYLYSRGLGVRRDLARAWELSRAAADAGDHHAMFNLAAINTAADGRYATFEETLGFLEAPVRAGLPAAMVLRADLLARVDRDAEAVDLYRRAAELGHTGAMHALGAWARDGIAGPPDHTEAAHWFLRQAAGGDPAGRKRADELFRSMSPNEIAEARRRAGRVSRPG